jgi:hypothetical protein
MNYMWVYQMSNWFLGALVVSVFTGLSLAGLSLTRPWVGSLDSHHNDMVASFAASAGVLYAVLLAMIAVASWNNYTTTDAYVSQEADLVHSLFRDIEGYPRPERDQLRALLREYVDNVIHTEWPALQRGLTDRRAALVVDDIFAGWLRFEPKTEAQKLIVGETLSQLNALQAVRRNRISTGITGLDPILWLVVLVGAVLSLGICYLFWMPNKRLHQLMIGILGVMIGMVVYLILALDHPLWGELSIQPTAFQAVADSMDRVLHPMTPGERRLQLH